MEVLRIDRSQKGAGFLAGQQQPDELLLIDFVCGCLWWFASCCSFTVVLGSMQPRTGYDYQREVVAREIYIYIFFYRDMLDMLFFYLPYL